MNTSVEDSWLLCRQYKLGGNETVTANYSQPGDDNLCKMVLETTPQFLLVDAGLNFIAVVLFLFARVVPPETNSRSKSVSAGTGAAAALKLTQTASGDKNVWGNVQSNFLLLSAILFAAGLLTITILWSLGWSLVYRDTEPEAIIMMILFWIFQICYYGLTRSRRADWINCIIPRRMHSAVRRAQLYRFNLASTSWTVFLLIGMLCVPFLSISLALDLRNVIVLMMCDSLMTTIWCIALRLSVVKKMARVLPSRSTKQAASLAIIDIRRHQQLQKNRKSFQELIVRTGVEVAMFSGATVGFAIILLSRVLESPRLFIIIFAQFFGPITIAIGTGVGIFHVIQGAKAVHRKIFKKVKIPTQVGEWKTQNSG